MYTLILTCLYILFNITWIYFKIAITHMYLHLWSNSQHVCFYLQSRYSFKRLWIINVKLVKNCAIVESWWSSQKKSYRHRQCHHIQFLLTIILCPLRVGLYWTLNADGKISARSSKGNFKVLSRYVASLGWTELNFVGTLSNPDWSLNGSGLNFELIQP